MGFASIFHTYADSLDLPSPCRSLVVGPGDDDDDIKYWASKGECTAVDPNERESNLCTFECGLLEDFWAVWHSRFNVVWATHVLEHARNPGGFLDRCHFILKTEGHLFVAVPPAKHNIVGGHLSIWNMGLLWYHLILAGFDVANGSFIKLGYNIFAHVKVIDEPLYHKDLGLRYDHGDIEKLAKAGLWPKGFDAKQDFDGDITVWNWPLTCHP